jgi:tetratricopeptide (TPR) repeat protein
MRYARWIVLIALLLWLAVACRSRSSMRIRTLNKDKDRMENLKEAAKDTIPKPAKVDTVSKEVQELKAEHYNFLTNLIINNMVRAQQAAYDGRFSEAEKLLLQALKWHTTPGALMLLGSVYEVQGKARAADSCWQEARRLDPNADSRITEFPRQEETKPSPPSPDGK